MASEGSDSSDNDLTARTSPTIDPKDENNDDFGSDHVNVFESTKSEKRGLRVAVLKTPLITASLVFLLIVSSCSIGIVGLLYSKDIYHLIYFGIGVTGTGILTSILETLLISQSVRALIKLRKAQEIISNGLTHVDDSDGHALEVLDKKASKLVETTSNSDYQLKKMSLSDQIYLFVATLLFNFSFNLIYWGIAVTQMKFNPPVWYPYLLVDMLIGLVSPLFFCLAINLFGSVGRELTHGKLRSESLVPAVLTFVKYVLESETSKYPFWNIVNYFHFPVIPNEEKTNEQNPFKYQFYNSRLNLASLCLLGMVLVTFCLSITYIVGQLLTGEEYVLSCGDAGSGYNCFEHTSKEYVNCSSVDPNEMIELDCFRFNRVGVHNDPIGVVITALFLYIACDKFLTVVFKFVKEFFRIYPSRLWGFGVAGFGLVLLMLCFACVGIHIAIHSVFFNFQKLLQLFIISMDIFLSGILLFTVKVTGKK